MLLLGIVLNIPSLILIVTEYKNVFLSALAAVLTLFSIICFTGVIVEYKENNLEN